METNPQLIAQARIRNSQRRPHRMSMAAERVGHFRRDWTPTESDMDLLRIVRSLTYRCNLGIYEHGLSHIGPEGVSLVEPNVILVDDGMQSGSPIQHPMLVSGPMLDAVIKFRRPVLGYTRLYSAEFMGYHDCVVAYDDFDSESVDPTDKRPVMVQEFPSRENMDLVHRRQAQIASVHGTITRSPGMRLEGATVHEDAIAIRIAIASDRAHVQLTSDGETWRPHDRTMGWIADRPGQTSAFIGHQYDFGIRSWNAAVALGDRWGAPMSIRPQKGGAYLSVIGPGRCLYAVGSLTDVAPVDDQTWNLC